MIEVANGTKTGLDAQNGIKKGKSETSKYAFLKDTQNWMITGDCGVSSTFSFSYLPAGCQNWLKQETVASIKI
jgi:hypothetical protein